MKHCAVSIALAIAVVALRAPAGSAPSTHAAAAATLEGALRPLGHGTARSWVRVAPSGVPLAMGVTFVGDVTSGLSPRTSETVLPLPRVANVPFRTAVVNWNPHGHPPAGIYTVPHFDVHFYEIDERTRLAITPSSRDARVRPAPALVPAGYVVDPGAPIVPAMGLHYLPSAAPEFHGGRFTASPIFGYWDGHAAFVEGMVTTAFLASHASKTAPIGRPAAVERAGYYPTRWSVTYDRNTRSAGVTFDDFAARRAR